MKKMLFLLALSLISCKESTRSNIEYSLTTITYIPDSLKEKHRSWVLETVRAANQHLSAGDYENIDETIIQVERTADNLFEVETYGLRKQFSDGTFDYMDYKPNELNTYEKRILDSLVNSY